MAIEHVRNGTAGKPNESVNLDVLRSVAVLLVLVSHFPPVLGFPHPVWLALGHFGVLIFFIHTSLVLMMSLQRLEGEGAAVIRRFYIRRAFRIYPLSVCVILLLMTLRIPAFFGGHYQTPDTLDLWSNLLLLQNITHSKPMLGPLWSLPYEVQMYLALPFVYCLGKRFRRPVLGIAAASVVWY